MSNSASLKRSGATQTKDGRARPLFVLAAPAALGVVLSIYLWFATGAGASPLCPAGSGCEIVLASAYAWLLGVPLPVYGLAYYAAVGALALTTFDPRQRWRLLLPLTAAGAAASVVFTGVQQFVLRASCPLCLLSAALSVALFGLVVALRPERPKGRVWLGPAGAAAAAVLFIVGGYAFAQRLPADNAYAEGLARHLTATGVVFYGTYWCRFCEEQKRLFGPAARYLPYVECDPRGRGAQPEVCLRARVRAYPTWDIGGWRFEGVISLADLARLSGYRPPP